VLLTLAIHHQAQIRKILSQIHQIAQVIMIVIVHARRFIIIIIINIIVVGRMRSVLVEVARYIAHIVRVEIVVVVDELPQLMLRHDLRRPPANVVKVHDLVGVCAVYIIGVGV
jgi:hypothetical protein